MPVTVTFSDGGTSTAAANAAVWIPSGLYDRIALELTVPRDAQKTLAATASYPSRGLAGYPQSGLVAVPLDYARYRPVLLDCHQRRRSAVVRGFSGFREGSVG